MANMKFTALPPPPKQGWEYEGPKMGSMNDPLGQRATLKFNGIYIIGLNTDGSFEIIQDNVMRSA